jgi:hypothetical protein
MLYHRKLQPIVVRNKREQDAAFVQGYSMSPSGITQAEMLEKKREELVRQIEEIDDDLAMLRGEIDPEDDPEPVNMLKGIEGGIRVEVEDDVPQPPVETPTEARSRKSKEAWARRRANQS